MLIYAINYIININQKQDDFKNFCKIIYLNLRQLLYLPSEFWSIKGVNVMARKGENIYKRKDGRWEGRYIIGYTTEGKAQYKSIYGRSYAEIREKLFDRNVRVDREACLHAVGVNEVDDFFRIVRGIQVETQHIGPRLCETLHVIFRGYYHEMRIQRSGRNRSYRIHYGKAVRNVRHENPVHNVEMEDVCMAVHEPHVILKTEEICGEH